MIQPVEPTYDLSDIIAIVSLVVAVLSVASHIYFQYLGAQREKNKIRFGIVYQEQFRVCKELYTRLSHLRDAVESCTGSQLSPSARHNLRPQLDRRAEAFRRSLRQNDVVLDGDMKVELNNAWEVFKVNLYDYDDAEDRTGDKLPTQARKDVLAVLDTARARLAPHIRRTYGIEK